MENVIPEWNEVIVDSFSTVKRKIFSDLKKPEADLIYVVQGVRRCVKSTLLSQIVDHFLLNRENCFFINFEDPRLSAGKSPNIGKSFETLVFQALLAKYQEVYYWRGGRG